MLTVLMYTLGVVLFVLGVAASIGLHEVGHLVPAKKFGVKVTQYFVGFGRTLWSTRRGETEYGVKAIPLGGYVKLVGMLPPGREDEVDEQGRLKVRKSNTGMFTQLISDARAAEYELVEEGDERPAVLQAAVVEEGHRDGRRPDGEPGAGIPALRGRLHDSRRTRRHHDHRRGLRLRHRGDRGDAGPAAAEVHGRRPGRPGQGRRAPGR